MRPGDLIFVRGNGLMSRAIRQVTGGHFNHVEIVMNGDESIGAMQGEGVRLCRFREAFKDEEWTARKVPSASDREAGQASMKAHEMLGRKYDNRGLFGVWLRFALKALGWHIKANNTNDQKAFFCSELAAECYRQTGIKLTENDPSLTSPEDLYMATVATA